VDYERSIIISVATWKSFSDILHKYHGEIINGMRTDITLLRNAFTDILISYRNKIM